MNTEELRLSEDKKAFKRIDFALVFLISFSPIYGTVFLYLNKVCTRSVSIMGVGVDSSNKFSLFFNPGSVNCLTESELRGVLKHEASHILLNHIFRAKEKSLDHQHYNIAADVSINGSIEGLPEGVLYAKQFGLKDGLTSEYYYDNIKRNESCQSCGGDSNPDNDGEGGNEGGDGQDKEEKCKECGNPVNENGEAKNGSQGNVRGDHSMWRDIDPDGILREKVRAINQKAIKAQSEKGWGSIPGELAAQIIAANKSVVNWKRNLRYFISKLVRRGRMSTRMRPNRKYGYTHAGTKKAYLSKILVGVDTSGSISDSDLSDFLAEMNSMVSHVECQIVCFDTRMQGAPIDFKKKGRLTVKGRGGTDFTELLEYGDKHKYDGVIVFTDGFAPFPTKPKNVKVLWALTKDGEEVFPPYGKRVVIDK